MIDAMMTEYAQEHANVGEIRDIFKGQRFAREQRGDHQWKRRVLGAGNPYDAIQRLAADDPNTIQGTPRFQKKSELALFCAGPVLRAFALSRFAFGGVPHLFPSLSLLRLAAAKVRPQCFGEALTRGGVARASGARRNRISTIRHRPVIGAGQAHDFESFKERRQTAHASGANMVS